VTIVTDHFGLQWLQRKKEDVMSKRMMVWSMAMSELKYTVVYAKGKGNVADYLSRHPLKEKKQRHPIIAPLLTRSMVKLLGKPASIKQSAAALEESERRAEERKEKKAARTHAAVEEGRREQQEPVAPADAAAAPVEEPAAPAPAPAPMQDDEAPVPAAGDDDDTPALRTWIIEEQKRDPECRAAKALIQTGKVPAGLVSEEQAQRLAEGVEIENDVLVSKWRDPRSEILHTRLVVPLALRTAALKELHDAPIAGHLGVEGTYNRVRERFM
jgi:hypothetical protein